MIRKSPAHSSKIEKEIRFSILVATFVFLFELQYAWKGKGHLDTDGFIINKNKESVRKKIIHISDGRWCWTWQKNKWKTSIRHGFFSTKIRHVHHHRTNQCEFSRRSSLFEFVSNNLIIEESTIENKFDDFQLECNVVHHVSNLFFTEERKKKQIDSIFQRQIYF